MALKKPDIDSLKGEFKFTTSRSSGPGGQSVNKVNTKVTLRWDVQGSALLDEDQRAIIMVKLAKIINSEGELVLTAQSNRSQLQNKEEVINKLAASITKAFAVRKARKATKPTKASVQRRLTAKKKLSDKKKLRGGVG
jgi:ribosome-associated protein